MATKILELATKLKPKSPAWRLKLRKMIESVSLIQQLKVFTGNQTCAVFGQMATKEKNKLGRLVKIKPINDVSPSHLFLVQKLHQLRRTGGSGDKNDRNPGKA